MQRPGSSHSGLSQASSCLLLSRSSETLQGKIRGGCPYAKTQVSGGGCGGALGLFWVLGGCDGAPLALTCWAVASLKLKQQWWLVGGIQPMEQVSLLRNIIHHKLISREKVFEYNKIFIIYYLLLLFHQSRYLWNKVSELQTLWETNSATRVQYLNTILFIFNLKISSQNFGIGRSPCKIIVTPFILTWT